MTEPTPIKAYKGYKYGSFEEMCEQTRIKQRGIVRNRGEAYKKYQHKYYLEKVRRIKLNQINET
jgi:hypothetical protein